MTKVELLEFPWIRKVLESPSHRLFVNFLYPVPFDQLTEDGCMLDGEYKYCIRRDIDGVLIVVEYFLVDGEWKENNTLQIDEVEVCKEFAGGIFWHGIPGELYKY